jgi:hypothetical protein
MTSVPQTQPKTLLNETRYVVRRRTYHVRTIMDVSEVLAQIITEQFSGALRINVGPRGSLQNVEVEERAKL